MRFVLGVPRQLHGRRPALLDAELHEEGVPARLEHAPDLAEKAQRPQVEDELRRHLLVQRQPGPPDPVERLLVQRRVPTAGLGFLFGQLDRRHIGHVLVVHDEVHAGVFEGEKLAVGLDAGRVPPTFPAQRQLGCQEGPGDVEEDIPDALAFLRGEPPGQLARHVAEPPSDFHDGAGLARPPAELPEIVGEQAPVGEPVERRGRVPEQMRHGGLDVLEMVLLCGDVMHVKVREVACAFELRRAGPALPDLLQQQVPAGVTTVLRRHLRAVVAEGVAGQGPVFQAPAAGLAVGPADPAAELREQQADRGLTVHGGEQRGAFVVDAHQRDGVVKRGEPPFVVRVLVHHHVGHPPGAERQHVVRQRQRVHYPSHSGVVTE